MNSFEPLPILLVIAIVAVGWLVIASIQYIYTIYILAKINSFWGLVGMSLLLLVLYLLFSYVSGAGVYLFPFVDPVNPQNNNLI